MKPINPAILMAMRNKRPAGQQTTPMEMMALRDTARSGGSPLSYVDRFLGQPGGAFLMNLLAQSGYSTMPDSPFGAVGRASIETEAQLRARMLEDKALKRQASRDDIQDRLIESQIGINRVKADPANQNPTAGNVASTFEGENGNVWVFQRGDTQPQDTGVPFRKSRRFQENSDGSITLYGEDGQVLRTVRSAETARDQAITGVETELATDDARTADQDIRLGESTIFEVGEIIDDVNDMLGEVGITTTGPLGAVLQQVPGSSARDFAATRDRITAFLSLDKIAEMKSQSSTGATGLGAVNEKEFDALSKARTNLDQAQSPSQMKKALRELLARLNRIQGIALQDIETAQRAGGQVSSGFELVED